MEANFDSEIDRLAALQELDRRLKDQNERIAALRGDADGFEADLARQRAAVRTSTVERDALEAKRAEMESRLEADGSRLRDNRMRLNRVRNDRELLALQREIDLGKEANQQLEEELFAVMEQLEQLGSQLAEAEQSLRDLEERAGREVAQRRSEALEMDRSLQGDRERRAALVEGMDPSLRSMYEQIFERRGGSAVVVVRNGTCLGCHMNLPPQLFNELQKFRDIRQCPNCRRILFWRREPQ